MASTSYNKMDQHYEIAQNYISWIQEVLMQSFPNITKEDAGGLSVRFLADVNRDNPDCFNELIVELGYESLEELVEKTDQYRDGQKGTKCPE